MECRIRGVSVHYEEAGSGRPVLLLHGRPLDHRHIFSDMEPLFATRHGWRRIYPDLPGMGLTRPEDWLRCQDDVLDLLGEFVDAVAPGERLVVVGGSYGGYLARGLVHHRERQIDGLFIYVPRIVAGDEVPELPEHRVLREDPRFLAALESDEQDWRELAVVQSVQMLEAARADFRPAAAMADEGFLERLRRQDQFSFAVDELPEPMPAPALILTGRFDQIVGYRQAFRILDNYPRATFAVLDSAGHILALEQRTLFRALASEWLDRVEEYVSQGK